MIWDGIKIKLKDLFSSAIQLLIEFLRWIVIALFLILIYRLSKEIIDPLFTDEIMWKTANQLLNLALYGGIITGIKKIHSSLALLTLSSLLFVLILLDKYIIKLFQKIIEFFQVYGEERI